MDDAAGGGMVQNVCTLATVRALNTHDASSVAGRLSTTM